MKRTMIFLMAFALLLTSVAFAESFNAKVISVIDGDNIIVARDNKLCRVRFIAIDCPELQQDYGIRARQFVTDLLLGQDVKVDARVLDFDKRFLSVVTLGDKDVGLEIARAGLAWYDDRSHHYPQIAKAEKDAREQHAGLWSMTNAISPWQFRQKQLGIRAIMSPNPSYSGCSGGFGFSRSDNFGYGWVDASWPPSGAVSVSPVTSEVRCNIISAPPIEGGGPNCGSPASNNGPGRNSL
jgi:endonuclease YncB( thermonuclease family)